MDARTLSELARLCGAELEGDGSKLVVGPASLEEARDDQISFLGNPRYAEELEKTCAGAVLLPPGVPAPRGGGEGDVSVDRQGPRGRVALLRHPHPNRAFTRIVEAFLPSQARLDPGIHESAVVAADARLGPRVSIGPNAVIGAGSEIGADVIIHAGTIIGAGCEIGADSLLYAGVVLYDRVRLGKAVILHAGVVLGSDGFGFDPTEEGWDKIPQCGTVLIEDDVEMGACCTVDRGRFGATRIGRGTKLDNQVHIAHNVVVGEHSLLIAQVGIAGSSRLGKRVILAGQVGVTGHLEIGDGARVSAQSGVDKSLPGGKDYFGSPARPQTEAIRLQALVAKLPAMKKRLAEFEKRLRELEEKA